MDRSTRRGDRRGRQWPHQLLASSDEQLVRRVLAGDDEAFELLFDRHVADAFWFARETLGSEVEAEEAVGHSFAAARAYLEARERGVEFGPWLQAILGNHCLSMIQARGPRPRRPPANVVDLGDWRRRRGRLGLALPLAPLTGVREGLLALCGIGGTGAAATGAAGGGASLVAGTLAKVAVAALLAGGVGAAGKAVVEREPPARAAAVADAGTSHGTAAVPGALKLVRGAPGLSLERVARELRRARAEAPERAGRSRPPVEAPATAVPEAPVAAAPTAPVVAHAAPTPGALAAPAPHATPGAPAAGVGQAVIEEVERSVAESLPQPGGDPSPPGKPDPLPPPVVETLEGLPPIGDDLPVTPEKLSEELGGLLAPPEPPPPTTP